METNIRELHESVAGNWQLLLRYAGRMSFGDDEFDEDTFLDIIKESFDYFKTAHSVTSLPAEASNSMDSYLNYMEIYGLVCSYANYPRLMADNAKADAFEATTLVAKALIEEILHGDFSDAVIGVEFDKKRGGVKSYQYSLETGDLTKLIKLVQKLNK